MVTSTINHSEVGVMFTNLAIVWGPHIVIIIDQLVKTRVSGCRTWVLGRLVDTQVGTRNKSVPTENEKCVGFKNLHTSNIGYKMLHNIGDLPKAS